MTITGCAKYTKYFDRLKFPIILLEEAAEVLESHCISAIISKNL